MAMISYGDRGIIGVINISSTVNLEPEFYGMLPEGVAVLTARVELPKTTPEELEKLAAKARDAAYQLSTAKPNVIVFACTSGSFIKGAGYDLEVTKDLETAANGVPVVTTSTALLQALEALRIKKFAFCSPYTEIINQRAESYFKNNGYNICCVEGLGLDTDYAIGEQTTKTVWDLVHRVNTPEAQAVIISCTNLRSAEILQQLEDDLGKPIITANQASLWYALRKMGIQDEIMGFGSLMQKQLKKL